MPPLVSKIEKKILAEYSPEDLIEGEITRIAGKASLHLATYLRLLGEYKLKYVLPFIESLLEDTKESILIFAVHKETIAKLEQALAKYEPLIITGSVPKAKRHGIVKEFQTNPKRRLFMGNIQACGVGFTMTKATRVLFVEFSWVDGENSQASDRAHRIGQGQSVLVQYVVLKDSFDRQRMERLLMKRALSI
jgi:SWI/SNF-related matrix-associated actin-dependent regulator 1 of chromatin subfamily A